MPDNLIKPFFKRGSGPLVSILLPTRGRPKLLCEAIDSLHSLAWNPSHLEYVLKIDDDDTETIELSERLEKVLPLKKIVSPRGNGFFDMHHWVNEMSRMASGDWLFLTNDDAKMMTQNWDQMVQFCGTSNAWEGIEDVCLLAAFTARRPFAQEFIFLRKKTFNLLGHFSQSPHNDNWIYSALKFMGATLFLQVYIDHFSEYMEDDTRQQSEKAYGTTIDTLNSVEAKRLRIEDLEVMQNHFEKVQAGMKWMDKPEMDSWHWWKSSTDGRKKVGYVMPDLATVLFLDEKNPGSATAVPIKDVGGLFCVLE